VRQGTDWCRGKYDANDRGGAASMWHRTQDAVEAESTFNFEDGSNPVARYNRQAFESRLLVDGRPTKRRARQESRPRKT